MEGLFLDLFLVTTYLRTWYLGSMPVMTLLDKGFAQLIGTTNSEFVFTRRVLSGGSKINCLFHGMTNDLDDAGGGVSSPVCNNEVQNG